MGIYLFSRLHRHDKSRASTGLENTEVLINYSMLPVSINNLNIPVHITQLSGLYKNEKWFV